MKCVSVLMMVAACGLMVGCSSADYSKNMRAATVQSTAVVVTKILLDEVALENYDKTKSTAIEVATEVSKFLDTGKIGDLPIDAARDAVVKFMVSKGWSQYIPAVIALFDIAAAQILPVEKLGADNIAIIKMGLDEIVVSANTSKIDWRRPVTVTKSRSGYRVVIRSK